VGFDESGIVQMIAANTDQYVIADDDRCGGGRVVQFRIGNLDFPALLTGSRIE